MTVPPGDEAVDDALQLHEGDSRGPAGLLDENHRVGGQARLLQPVTKSTGDGPVGSQGRRGPSQQSGIARLEAEPGGVAGHVGTILVDDTDHAQGHPDPPDGQPVRTHPSVDHLTDRIGEGRHLAEPSGHGRHPGPVEPQPIHGGGVGSRPIGLGHILGIGRQDALDPLFQQLSGEQESLVADRRGGPGQYPTGLA